LPKSGTKQQKNKKMIKINKSTIDVKKWCHVLKSCGLIWTHNLNKSMHISLKLLNLKS
jgi:hypothetical protein